MKPETAVIEKTTLANNLLSAAMGQTDAFELYVEDSNVLTAVFVKGQLRDVEQKGTTGASIRAVKDGHIGFSHTNKLAQPQELVDSASRLAPYGRPYNFKFAPAATATADERYNPAVEDISPDSLVSIGESARKLMAEAAPDAMFGGRFTTGHEFSRVITSEGQDAKERKSFFNFYVQAELNSEGDFLSVWDGRFRNGMLTKDDILNAVRRVARDFQIARTPVPVSPGKRRVLLTPGAVSDVITPIIVSVNGSNIEKKMSRWIKSRGEKVFDSRITIFDDPTIPDGSGSGAYDGEGTPKVVRPIIDAGVLCNFVHSRATAAAIGDDPTGNGQRSVASTARPGPHNVVMAPGEERLSDLRAQVDGGLYVDQLLGVFTSNFLAGQVTGNISLGYVLDQGERLGRVKNVAMNLNAFDTLNGSIVGISEEREWVGNQYLPYMLLDDVSISAR